MTAGFIRLIPRQPVMPNGPEGYKPRRAIGFAPWPAVLEWEVVWDTETFADQEDRLREVLALPDDEDPDMGGWFSTTRKTRLVASWRALIDS